MRANNADWRAQVDETRRQKERDKADEQSNLTQIQHKLTHGSDVEIARHLKLRLKALFGDIVCAEGAIWRYNETHWEAMDDDHVRQMAMGFDGIRIGAKRFVRLSKSRLDSILNEMKVMIANRDFFAEPETGINCASGFIMVSDDGEACQIAHEPGHRQRHCLPGRWSEDVDPTPPKDSLFGRLLAGSFLDDEDADEKARLMAEAAGCAALGCSPNLVEPKAIVLHGPSAGNGKSQFLDALRGLLPPSAICSIPAEKMSDEKHLTGLVGKHLNACDELSGSKAIGSDAFKAVVTGDYVTARDVYRSRIEFRPRALNVFATNVLPTFSGGMDRGVQRRLLVVSFNRTIPEDERIDHIGARIAKEEPGILLAWAVGGACELVKRGRYGPVESCITALNDWRLHDPVLAWIDACVEHKPVRKDHLGSLWPRLATGEVFKNFSRWCENEGYDARTLPAVNRFSQRLSAAGIVVKRLNTGSHVFGIHTK